MRRNGSGFGILVLAVVVVIVLLLVARAWSDMAPHALEVSATQGGVDGRGSEDEPHSPGHLPDLQDMKRQTRAHEEQVQEALNAVP